MKAPTFTFAGGVLSKGLYGRVDLNKYQTGLARAENFFVAVEGGVEKRWGFYYTGKRKFQDKLSKLIPWRIANDDSYMLEFGHHYIRFIRFGGYVDIPPGHVHLPGNEAVSIAGFMEVPTLYDHEDVAKLKYTFANDTMRINHPDYDERILTRLGLYDWEFDPETYSPHPAWTGGGTATFHDTTTGDDNYVAEPVETEYKLSATLADGTETLPSPVISVLADTGFRRCWVEIDWSAVPGAIQYTIYKGKNGIFGFIGYSTATVYEDRNFAPSYDVVPLGKKLAFPTGEKPKVSEYYKQRVVRGGSLTKPQTLILSKPLVFNSLYTSVPQQDDDAVEIQLVGRERHTINHMIELKKFLIFTDSAEWVLGTTENRALTAATIDPVIETHYGSHPDLRPIPIGDRVLFIQNTTGAIRDMGYEFTSDAFKADDLSRLARDLFKDKVPVAWDYAQFPLNMASVVMSDGTINDMAYAREHEIWGWTDFTTKGKFLDVACVAEINEIATYVQTSRVINGVETFFIERMNITYNDRIEDMVYLDCALTYKEGGNYEELTVLDEYRISFRPLGITFSGEGAELQLEWGEETFRVLVDDASSEIIICSSAVDTIPIPEDILPEGVLLACADIISGLEHLEGEQVMILADGNVIDDLTVAVGQVTLPYTAARVHIGLYYDAEVETLGLDAQQLVGTYHMKAINEILIRLQNSRAVAVGGVNPNGRLPEVIPPRNQEDYSKPNNPLDGIYEISPHASWDHTAAIVVKSVGPLPCKILNIIPDITYGN